ncbi:copper amine oxidase N-terminal domain-containing protein [Paenibacillus sepulcri]
MKKLLVSVLGLSLLLPAITSAAAAPVSPIKASVNTPAAELRATLDYLLSEHFTLAVNALTKGYSKSKDAAEAYQALDQNVTDMKPVIASIYGAARAAEFVRIFREHNTYTNDLIKSSRNNDKALRGKVEGETAKFVKEFAAFLNAVTAAKLPRKTAEEMLQLHENKVQKAFDEYAAGDYQDAYKAYREGIYEVFKLSKVLSSAIAAQMPDKYQQTRADTEAADLRSLLSRLLSEHFALSTLQMQEQFDTRGASDALLIAEAANTEDLNVAMASVYGAADGIAFKKIWVINHLNAQSDYVNAVKNNNTPNLENIKSRIDDSTTELAAFLDTATNKNLPLAAGQAALRKHEGQVQQVFDQYAAGNYKGAAKTSREGFKFMFGIGKSLSSVIVLQFNEKYAENMPVTPPDPNPVPSSPAATTIWMKVNSKQLKLNGIVSQMDTTPFVWNGLTFIPLRFLSDGIGAEAVFDAKTGMITVKADKDVLKFWVGKDYMTVNGVNKSVGTKVIVKDGRTAIPLRFIGELLGWDVHYQKSDQSITLTKPMS